MSAREAGFTLAEMLVALALLAVAAGLTVDGFSASRGAQRRIAAHDARLRSVSDAETYLRDRLERMVLRARFETARPYVDVDGAEDRLDFVAAAVPGAAAEREQLSLDAAGELTLVDDGAAERLLAGASRLRIDYYGQAVGEPEPAWRNDWSHQPSRPELVRVHVDFPPGDRRVWPELIVRPAAEVDGDCVVDGDTGACRGRA